MDKKLLTLPLLATVGCMAQAQTDPNHPNIVFVLADDMGFSGIHAYGGNQIPSPNIDFLADNGVVLRIRANDVSKIGRDTQGVRIMNIKGASKVVSVSESPVEESDEETVENETAE